ncbi:MAG: tetratricopeptide repeat protein [Bacteroidaceae bacterium]|nr:tetratricopeptide repeat protein [Bacteroidaceae bacterium]
MKNDYYDSEEFKEILDAYERSLKEGTTPYFDADDYADVADFYLNVDTPEKCFKCVNKGLELYPDDDQLLSVKSSACIFTHKYKEAEKIVKKLNPKNRETLYQKAQLEYALYGHVQKAEEMFTDWIALERSLFREENEEDEERFQEFQRDCYIHVITSFIELADSQIYDEELIKRWVEDYIVTFSPLGNYDSDLILADTVREENLFDMVVKVYSKILETNPYIKYGWTVLAAAQYSCDLYEDAIESADFALAVNPDDTDALLTKAHCLYTTNRFDEALPIFEQYSAKTTEIGQSLPLAICLISSGRNAEALEQLKRAEEYYSGFKNDKEYYAISCFEIADAYLALERVSEAERFIDIALELYPKNVHYQLLKGTLLLTHGDISGAMTLFVSYVEGMPDVIDATVQVVIRLLIYELETIAIELISTVEKFGTIYPKLCHLYPYKALAYIRTYQYDKFLRYLKRSQEQCPELTREVLSDLFPEDMNPKDYYQYMLKNL